MKVSRDARPRGPKHMLALFHLFSAGFPISFHAFFPPVTVSHLANGDTDCPERFKTLLDGDPSYFCSNLSGISSGEFRSHCVERCSHGD